MAHLAATRSEVDSAQVNRVAVKLFLSIAEQWQLSEAQCCTLAGLGSRTTLHNWRKHLEADETVRLSHDTLERLSWIAGIYKSLQILFAEPQQWRNWVHQPNRDFAGQSALQRMLAGRVVDLADVRRYLEAWRGAQYA